LYPLEYCDDSLSTYDYPKRFNSKQSKITVSYKTTYSTFSSRGFVIGWIAFKNSEHHTNNLSTKNRKSSSIVGEGKIEREEKALP